MSEYKENRSNAGSGRKHRYHGFRRLKHRLKRWLRRHKWVGVAAVMLAVGLLVAGYMLMNSYRQQGRYEIAASNNIDVGTGYRQIEYNGKSYRYNNRITTILYAGVDSEGDLEPMAKYGSAPRADSISLVVMDELHKSTTIIALNRSTITPIHRYTLNGRDRGVFDDFLCWAYTYGNGGKVSCTNLCDAVSRLLFDVPIDGYVVSSRASIPMIADALGPVQVTVPNDDLEEYGFIKGETATIDGTNLEQFVRSRDIGVDFSNDSRMARQQAYIEGAMGKLTDLLTNHPSAAWETLEKAENCVQTNITRSRYLDLTKVLKTTGYTPGSYYIPEGKDVVGFKYDEFYPDLDALRAKVVEIFYLEQ